MRASPTGRDGSAVVIGAGIAGLLAARGLAEHVGEVTVLDRDRLPEEAVPRGGAPQSAHAHGLLARGLRALEELYPGLTAELVARGAEPGDLQEDFRWIFDGRPLARASSGLRGLLVSRGLLEREIRRRTAADPRIRIVDGVDVTGLAHDGHGRVLGVLSLVRDDPQGRMLPRWDADLVVDASGRSSRAPQWLASMGFAPPAEDRVEMDMAYATRHYRREPHHLDGAFGVSVGATPAVPRGGVLLAQEGDRWICTVTGYAGNRPPIDPDGFEAFAASMRSPVMHQVISSAEPLDEPRRFRIPASVRRRYEQLQRAPLGLLVLGDAVCSFNPVYGQGMTVAATEALILRDLLRTRSGRDLASVFHRGSRAAEVILAWT